MEGRMARLLQELQCRGHRPAEGLNRHGYFHLVVLEVHVPVRQLVGEPEAHGVLQTLRLFYIRPLDHAFLGREGAIGLQEVPKQLLHMAGVEDDVNLSSAGRVGEGGSPRRHVTAQHSAHPVVTPVAIHRQGVHPQAGIVELRQRQEDELALGRCRQPVV